MYPATKGCVIVLSNTCLTNNASGDLTRGAYPDFAAIRNIQFIYTVLTCKITVLLKDTCIRGKDRKPPRPRVLPWMLATASLGEKNGWEMKNVSWGFDCLGACSV